LQNGFPKEKGYLISFGREELECPEWAIGEGEFLLELHLVTEEMTSREVR